MFHAYKNTVTVTELYSVGMRGGGAALAMAGDGLVLATTDLLTLIRWNLNIRGKALVNGITFSGAAPRTTVTPIKNHVRPLSETGLTCDAGAISLSAFG